MIKVIPESMYLQELRGVFYKQTKRDIYSNENTVELFRQHFQLVDTEHIQYTMTLDQLNLEHLIHMTPMSWGVPAEVIAEVKQKDQEEITFDFSIMYGKKKSKWNT